jgi:glycerate-2-kinase
MGIRKNPYIGEAEAVGMMLLEEVGEHEYYLAGGESTVTVRGEGTGGRSQHLCLSLHDEPCDCFSAGTDGLDGSSDAAGAFLDADSRGDDWRDYFEAADSATFFARSRSQLITGATGTNVCDITILKKH